MGKKESPQPEWNPPEQVLVFLDRLSAINFGWASTQRLGTLVKVSDKHCEVHFTNGDKYVGQLEDLRKLEVRTEGRINLA